MTMNRRDMMTAVGALGAGLVAAEVAQLNQAMGQAPRKQRGRPRLPHR
ncbi:MAG: hypothetical protein HC898_05630 [Phycisphaerales bacterium]|nr:hypothetical protein [Phycisphaerales bacterium]